MTFTHSRRARETSASDVPTGIPHGRLASYGEEDVTWGFMSSGAFDAFRQVGVEPQHVDNRTTGRRRRSLRPTSNADRNAPKIPVNNQQPRSGKETGDARKPDVVEGLQDPFGAQQFRYGDPAWRRLTHLLLSRHDVLFSNFRQ